MLMHEWDSWRLQWWRDLLTENHTVAWAVKTTYEENKYVEYSSDGKWGKHTPPPIHTHRHKHTQKAIMLSMVRRICDWLLCVFTCCLSLLSPHLSVSTITPSLQVSFSLSFFCRNLSLTQKRRRWVEGFALIWSHAHTQPLTNQNARRANPGY